LNGDFDHRISKLVELALAVGKVPVIEFVDFDQVLIADKNENIDRPTSNEIVNDLELNQKNKFELQVNEPIGNSEYIKK
jgi:hypothetical protein